MKKLLPVCLLLLSLGSCTSDSDTDTDATEATRPATQTPAELKPAVPDSTQNQKIYARYKRLTDRYKQQAYVPEKVYIGQPATLQLNSHPDAPKYKTALSKGLEKGANFAGSYAIVTVGCGTACQQNYVVNVRTGQVHDKVQSKEGAFYQPESRIFIANPPDSTINYTNCVSCAPVIYLFENEKFKMIASDTL
ncbi:MAG: hypothetical protein LPJ89_10400 [Hymenobacteraceae bacterium]|nr:hypothetical protein [Hymenobacteraceae bacterium]MDX5397565.1 hypothetical protein [Hymenobacteraceae bacterium]MDX5444179.1 hypothetical protein [Hymenobacteraceae bacterium]MDX5513645.1 hypothetical protein [Hymenobacteraceae bacterium]